MTCATCGSSEIITVSGPEALSVFPSGQRCANFFTHHLPRPQLEKRRLFTILDPNGIAFHSLDWEPSWRFFTDAVARTTLNGTFRMEEELPNNRLFGGHRRVVASVTLHSDR